MRFPLRPGPDLKSLANRHLGYTASDVSVERVWFGLLLPAIPIAYALYGFIAGEIWIPGRRGGPWLHLSGIDAYAIATAVFGVGLLFHIKHIWGGSERLSPWVQPAQILALIGIIAGIGTYIVRVFR